MSGSVGDPLQDKMGVENTLYLLRRSYTETIIVNLKEFSM